MYRNRQVDVGYPEPIDVIAQKRMGVSYQKGVVQMKRILTLILVVFILINAAGCGRQANKEEDPGPSKQVKTAGDNSTAQIKPGGPTPLRQGKPVPAKEAAASLEQLDQEVDELIKILDNTEKVNDKDLEF